MKVLNELAEEAVKSLSITFEKSQFGEVPIGKEETTLIFKKENEKEHLSSEDRLRYLGLLSL